MAKVIRLREVPDSLYRKLKAQAAKAGLSLEALLLREVRKIAQRPTPEPLRRRLRGTCFRGTACV